MALPSTADFGAEVGGEPWLVTAPRRSIAAPIASASASCRRENGNARSFPCGSRIWNKQAPSRGHVIITWVPSGILPVVLRRSVQKVRISYSPDSVLPESSTLRLPLCSWAGRVLGSSLECHFVGSAIGGAEWLSVGGRRVLITGSVGSDDRAGPGLRCSTSSTSPTEDQALHACPNSFRSGRLTRAPQPNFSTLLDVKRLHAVAHRIGEPGERDTLNSIAFAGLGDTAEFVDYVSVRIAAWFTLRQDRSRSNPFCIEQFVRAKWHRIRA